MVFISREKGFCVLEYARTNSKIVQRAFVREFSIKSRTAMQLMIWKIEDLYRGHAEMCLGRARLPT